MLHWVRHALRWIIVLFLLWAVPVYGLPVARQAIPGLCARWRLSGGFCGEPIQRALATLDHWVQRYLRPLPRHRRVQQATAEASRALRDVERRARSQVGDERVDQALRGADIALQRLEDAVGQTGGAREKLADVPENASVLLGQVRSSFERLRQLLTSAGRRAEEVSGAVEETKKALDAFSGVLPGSDQDGETPSPRP